MGLYTTWRSLQKLVKGQLNAHTTLNNWADALDKCVPYIVASAEVDAAAVASTKIYTVPAGKVFIPVMTIIRPSSLSTPGGTPTFAVGSNSTAYNNIVTATSLDLDTLGDYAPIIHPPSAIAVKTAFATGTDIYCRVSVAGTGTYICKVDLIGILV